MWLLDYVTKNSVNKAQTGCGNVTSSEMGNVAVNASLQHRDIPIISPFGVVYNPPVGENSVVLPINSNYACIGVVAPDKELEPGELMLYSSGGASIVLKNDGRVLINGKDVEKLWT